MEFKPLAAKCGFCGSTLIMTLTFECADVVIWFVILFGFMVVSMGEKVKDFGLLERGADEMLYRLEQCAEFVGDYA